MFFFSIRFFIAAKFFKEKEITVLPIWTANFSSVNTKDFFKSARVPNLELLSIRINRSFSNLIIACKRDTEIYVILRLH